MIRNHYLELPFPADLAGFGSFLAMYVRQYYGATNFGDKRLKTAAQPVNTKVPGARSG
jgi:hypothetical protein